MRLTASLTLCVGLAVLGGARAEAASAEVAQHSIVRVSWVDAKLTEALADLAAQAGVGFILDPAMPASARDATVTYASEGVQLRIALGNALRSAGLRYTIVNGAIWVSSPERVARRIVYKGAENIAEAEPMSRGEALNVLSPDDDIPSIGSLHKPYDPHRKPLPPSQNTVTGVTDFPAPSVWIESEDRGNQRFKYTSKPSFLKPEYRKDGNGDGGANMLGYVVSLIKSRPDWSREEILVHLERLLAASK